MALSIAALQLKAFAFAPAKTEHRAIAIFAFIFDSLFRLTRVCLPGSYIACFALGFHRTNFTLFEIPRHFGISRTRTWRGFEPFAGPTTPSDSKISIIRAARGYPKRNF